MISHLIQRKEKTYLEQAKIVSIDRLTGRISLFMKNGMISTGAYLYDINDLIEGMSVLVGKVDNSYVILNKMSNIPRTGKSYSVPKPVKNNTFIPGIEYVDNGYWNLAGFIGFNNVLFGNYDVGVEYNAFVRFPASTIPVGATIVECYLILTASADLSGEVCNANIYFNDVDDAVAPTTAAMADNLVLTSAVEWNDISAWTRITSGIGEPHSSPELKTILQEVIYRPGYSVGNALQLVIKNNASDTSAWRNAWPLIDGAPSYVVPPSLYVRWA